MTSNSNLYEVLGVENDASPQEIKRAYRRLAMKVHPDRVGNADKAEANKRFSEISAAYEILSDDDKRREYDRGSICKNFDDSNQYCNATCDSSLFKDPFEIFAQVFGSEFGESMNSRYNHEFNDPFNDAFHYMNNVASKQCFSNQSQWRDPLAKSKQFHFTSSSVINSGGKRIVSTTHVNNGKKTSRKEIIYPDGRREITTNGEAKETIFQDGRRERINYVSDGNSEDATKSSNFDDPAPSACAIFCRICCLICCPCCR